MATQEEKQAAVKVTADAFATLETTLDLIPNLVADVVSNVAACYALGIGRQSDKVIVDRKLTKAAGEVAGALATVIEAHERGTAAAVREGCDVPPALAVGEISPMSVGR